MPPRAARAAPVVDDDVLLAVDEDGSGLFDKTILRPSLRSDVYCDWIGRNGFDLDYKPNSKNKIPRRPTFWEMEPNKLYQLTKEYNEDKLHLIIKDVMRAFTLAAHVGGFVSHNEILGLLKTRGIATNLAECVEKKF